jgi:hypothetical protein
VQFATVWERKTIRVSSAFVTELLVAGRLYGDRVSFTPRNGSFPDLHNQNFIARHVSRGDPLIALAAR